jgi:hypothetical protein
MNIEANTPDIASPVVADNPNPDAVLPNEQPAAEPAPEAVEPVVEPGLGLSAREAIAARFKAQREADDAAIAEITGADVEPEELEPEPAPETGNEKYRVKVRGNEFEMSREDIIKTAGLTIEEAEGLPLPSLVRAAQINAAAEDYLAEARSTHRGARTAAAPAPATPADDVAEPELAPEPTETKRGTPDPRVVEIAQKIQYGDAEEAAAALQEFVERQIESRRTADLEGQFHDLTQKAVSEFAQANPDLFADPIATDVLYVAAMHEIKKDLIRLGADPAAVNEAVTNPTMAVEAYTLARQKGMEVRDPHAILGNAATAVRAKLNIGRGDPAAPQPAPSRTELKRSLTAQPRPATVPPVSSQQAPQPRSPSSVVLGMRKFRGQSS